MKRILLAYCAGLIDADGTIGIKKSTYNVRVTKDSTQATYSERVCIKQVRKEGVGLFRELFGGCRYISKPSTKNGLPLNSWLITDKKAAVFLKSILPFLRIKKKQAEVCLRLREVKEKSKKARMAKNRGHVGAAKRPKSLSNEMESLKQKIHSLNKTGRR